MPLTEIQHTRGGGMGAGLVKGGKKSFVEVH